MIKIKKKIKIKRMKLNKLEIDYNNILIIIYI